jgi:hypothetical protein
MQLPYVCRTTTAFPPLRSSNSELTSSADSASPSLAAQLPDGSPTYLLAL